MGESHQAIGREGGIVPLSTSAPGYVDFLNRMLEAERAGAKALVVFMDEHPRNGEAWKVLRQIQADEAHNCALIGRLLEKQGAAYSHATGEFYDKAVAVKGRRERIEYLVRGLKWAVKRFEEALPTLSPEARDVFTRMRDSHLRSIAACERVLKTLPR
jgi:nitronate monooxygenase